MENTLNLDSMRASGKVLAYTLAYLENNFVRPGISSLDISKKAEEIIKDHAGCRPAFLGYNSFPECACVSINQQVVHAIPRGDIILKDGDIVSIDCGVIFDEHYSDACRTICINVRDTRLKSLVKTTKESLDKGIEAALVGKRVGDISYAIQKCVERRGFKVNLDFTGHGIGKNLHMEPRVPNYGPPGVGEILVEGACLAIEPVVFDGPTDVYLDEDQWTIYSENNNLSAHFEDTVIITSKGPEIITRLKGDLNEGK